MDNNPSFVPSGGDVAPEEGENVNEGLPQTLKEINEATGRNYSSLDEAKKGMQETYKFVGALGDVKKKAEAYDALQKAKMSANEQTKEQTMKVDKLELLYERPDLREFPDVVDLILEGARAKGKKASEFFDESPLKGFIEKETKEKQAKNPQYTVPGQRLPEGEIGISPEEFNRLPLAEQKKIVEKLPGWNEPLPRGQHYSTPINSR